MIRYPESPTDTVLTTHKILWEAKAEYSGAGLRLNGGFTASEFRIFAESDSSVAKFQVAAKVISLPKNIDMKRVVVRFRGDAGSEEKVRNQVTTFIANVFPNPIGNELKIQSIKPAPKNLQISILPENSAKVTVVVPKGSTEINIPTRHILKGILMLEFDNGLFINRRRLIKN